MTIELGRFQARQGKMSNSDWVEANLARQKKMMEERQRAKLKKSAGCVRAIPTFQPRREENLDPHAMPMFTQDYSPSSLSNSFRIEKNTSPCPQEPSPLPPKELDSFLATKLEQADISEMVPSDDEDRCLASVTNEDGIEETVLASENEPDYEDIIKNVEKFVEEPAQRNCAYRCCITRDKKGVDKGIYPTYYLHLERGGGKKGVFLLAARKRKKSTTANYLISTDATDLSRDGGAFVGKVRSNAMGTVFTLFDNGKNPKKSGDLDVRQELAAVLYDTNVLGFKGPRKMTIIVPGMFDPQAETPLKRMKIQPDKDSLVERFKKSKCQNDYEHHQIVVMNNKSPIWNEDSQSYVLNFHGRVTQASVKNFQIIHPSDQDYIVMQFGRKSEEIFTMDFRYPLSALQAFGIAMTSFHGKLACE